MKLSHKFLLSFSLLLILFAGIIGLIFQGIFRKQALEMAISDLSTHAQDIAAGIELDPTKTTVGQGEAGGARRRYINQILSGDCSSEEFWLVDSDLNILLTSGKSPIACQSGKDCNLGQNLPPAAKTVVTAALAGKIAYSEAFSDTLGLPSLTVGAPVSLNNKVVAVLLLHTPISALETANRAILRTLWLSVALSLPLAAIASYAFSRRLSRPLEKMRSSAVTMAEGNYSVRSPEVGRDELTELAHSLNALAERLEAAELERNRQNALREDFMANISHELRTPVTVVRASLEAIADGIISGPEALDRAYRDMLEESRELETLINQLFELSRVRQSAFLFAHEELDLSLLAEDCLRSARRQAELQNLQLKMNSDVQSLPFVGDYERLREMLRTVLSNAITVSPEGETVELHLRADSIEVCDHGPGIPPEEREAVFERYYQGQQKSGKSGLGLAIASEVAKRHHITIELESEPGFTRFIFRLPQSPES